MFRKEKTQFKFKTYKSDAAPFFFFIDIFPIESNSFDRPVSSLLTRQIQNNPIIPLPIRVDKVFNGEYSVIIRPTEPITFPLNESDHAIINPIPFLQFGLEKLLYFTEIRSRERLFLSLKQKAVNHWWNATKDLYGNLPQLEEDFSAFLKAYLHTVLRAWIEDGDIIKAAIEYCTIINNICKERMLRNIISIEIDQSKEQVKMYKEKTIKYREKLKIYEEIEYHPEIVDVEVFDLSGASFLNYIFSKEEIIKNRDSYNMRNLKYIPILFYDDLQECMLQNLKYLENGELEIIDPSILLDSNIILVKNCDELNEFDLKRKYNWLKDLSEINISSLFNTLTTSINQPKGDANSF
ncbi:MAG: hypothetical protein ACFFAS_00440 [Promethearchaeota archaeon]